MGISCAWHIFFIFFTVSLLQLCSPRFFFKFGNIPTKIVWKIVCSMWRKFILICTLLTTFISMVSYWRIHSECHGCSSWIFAFLCYRITGTSGWLRMAEGILWDKIIYVLSFFFFVFHRLQNEKWMNVKAGDIIRLENNQFVVVCNNSYLFLLICRFFFNIITTKRIGNKTCKASVKSLE